MRRLLGQIRHILLVCKLLLKRSSFPKISIIIPFYNDSQYINQCLNSILYQFYPNLDIIIVNDCSKEKETSFLNKLNHKLSPKIIHNEVNKGLAATRNTGIHHSTGDFILFLDSDDIIFPCSLLLRSHYLLKKNSKSLAGSFAQMHSFTNQSSPSILKQLKISLKYKPTGTKHFIQSQGNCPFPVHAPLVKKKVITLFDGFNESMRHGAEDWDLWQKVLRHDYHFTSSHHVGSGYRQKQSSMVRQLSHFHLDEALKLYDKAYSIQQSLKDTPFHFDRGMNEYNYINTIAPRVFSYISMVYFSSSEIQSIQNILDENIPAELKEYIYKKLSYINYMKSGAIRFFAVQSFNELPPDKKDEFQTLKESITEFLKKDL